MADNSSPQGDSEQHPPGYEAREVSPMTQVGGQYTPGTYPTPELLPFPTGRYFILNNTRSLTSITIQSALDLLGESATLYLAPKSTWAVSSPISLKDHQELATWGYPTAEGDMATLKAESTCKPYVLKCTGVKGIRLRNLRIDGSAEIFGSDSGAKSLVRMGDKGAEGQHIDRCIIQHPQGSMCIHVHEGTGIKVTNNYIGPAGFERGSFPRALPARGITFCSKNGLVAGNEILDATAEGIALHSSPGTLLISNTIITRHRPGKIGIDMTWYHPNNGDYSSTRVVQNTIRIEGSYLKIGIAQGCGLNCAAEPHLMLVGGLVTHNLITSGLLNLQNPGSIGYGFAVSRVVNWRCTDNVSAENVVYQGSYNDEDKKTANRFDEPTPFIMSKDLENVRDGSEPSIVCNQIQSEFVMGDLDGLLRIQPAARVTSRSGPP